MAQNGRVQVVIVDDQPIFRDAARECLTARGYDVVAEAGCAASAVEAVLRHRPDAMLLDIHLGDDDGFAVCDALTRIRRGPAAVLTSAETNYELVPEEIESCGARAFNPKGASPPRRSRPVLAARLSPGTVGGRVAFASRHARYWAPDRLSAADRARRH